jgi:hypothetical protein
MSHSAATGKRMVSMNRLSPAVAEAVFPTPGRWEDARLPPKGRGLASPWI